ncbi:hypothetical protein [Coxiella-like endosymbiont of Rhipicephalus sanguineus]|uniref:hypothetical protein n=1 Tax=Coxiella-like endosymbiont of Rhipicephalus sanguineus TaxID=1955402 RepID=UPI00203F46ED|nr:hypothetical protein [Coxiella-like endosymbiont of Rhipicephalus sanguineus]
MITLIRHPPIITFIIAIFGYVFIEQGINTWLATFNKSFTSKAYNECRNGEYSFASLYYWAPIC